MADAYQWSARIDHQIGPNDTIYGRFGTSHSEQSSTNNTFIDTNLANFGLKSTNTVYSVNINELSPNVVNEFRAGYGRTSPVFLFDTTVPLGPRIRFRNEDVDRFGHYEGAPQGRVQNTFQYGDTITWVKGAHNVKAGGDFYRYQANSSLDVRVLGDFIFDTWADFAAGRPSEWQQRFGSTVRGHRTWLSGMFVQDDWRVTPTLTLNLGVRYELFGNVNEINDLISNLDLTCRESMGAAGTGPLGCFRVGQDVINNKHFWQPRIGFSWNPGGRKTVIRGGYGLVADFNFLNPITNMRGLPPLVVNSNLAGVENFSGGNSYANLIAGTATIQQQGRSSVGVLTDWLNFGDVNPFVDPGLTNPQVHQWSVGIQQQLPQDIVLKISYAGTKGNFRSVPGKST